MTIIIKNHRFLFVVDPVPNLKQCRPVCYIVDGNLQIVSNFAYHIIRNMKIFSMQIAI